MKELKDLTDEELYREHYNNLALVEQAQMNLRALNEEITKRRTKEKSNE